MNTTLRRQARLAHALRVTAARIDSDDAPYQWAHQGRCNCGHLAQTLTQRTATEIHAMGLERAGDWSQHAVDYCPTSGYPIDAVVDEMFAAGLTADDLVHLERLSDSRVLRRLPMGERSLDFRQRDHAVRYMRAWADLLDGDGDGHSTTVAAPSASLVR